MTSNTALRLLHPAPHPGISPLDAYLAQLSSDSSRRTQRAALDTCARLLGFRDASRCPWELLTYADLVRLRSTLATSRASATAARYLGAVRSVLQCAVALGLADPLEVSRALTVRNPRLVQHPAGRALERSEIAELLRAAQHHPISTTAARDAAVVALLAATGARRSEVASLDTSDWDHNESAVTIRQAKCAQTRTVWLPDWAADVVDEWVTHLADGPLLRRVTRTGAVLSTGLSGAAIAEILDRIAADAGLQCRPHDLRRSLITDLLTDGVDPLTVAAVSGHRRLESLRRYDRRSVDAGRIATQGRGL